MAEDRQRLLITGLKPDRERLSGTNKEAKMARTFKITGYLVDANDDYDAEDIEGIIERHTDLIANLKIVASLEWKWDDDCPENFKGCTAEDYERRF